MPPFIIGRVLAPRGLKGELRVQLFRDDPSYFSAQKLILRRPGEAEVERRIQKVRAEGNKAYVLSVEGIGDRNEAERWPKAELWVAPAWFGAEGPLELLVGARVEDAESGAALGKVVGLDHNGAQDLVEIDRGEGRSALIPFVPAFVAGIDLSPEGERCLRLRLIEGLLEE
ncbi:MAG: ribosome maturation factor RimM [Myxococcota bacterium]